MNEEKKSKMDQVFAKCCEELTETVSQQRKFLYLVGKDKIATMAECKEFLGFTSDDEKIANSLNQKFRNSLLIPLRTFLTKKLFNIDDTEAVKIWERENSAGKEKRDKVNAYLPKLTRERVKTTSSDDMENYIVLDNEQEDNSTDDV